MATAPETIRAGGSAPDQRSGQGGVARPRRGALVAAALTALVAVACALALPFAPVSVNEPTVRWPQEPARPESTLLALAAYRPLALDVRFTCEVARLAAAAGGVVVSTALPSTPQAGSTSLLVTAGGGRLQVRGLDRVLLDEPLPAGPCAYAITGRSAGRPSQVGSGPGPGEPPIPDVYAFAGPSNAELAVSRDGRELVRTTAEQLPDADVLVSSVTALPPTAAGDLAVELRVDDEFTSSPAPGKVALIAVLVLALTATGALLLWIDRGVVRPARRWRLRPPRIVDVVVPAVLVGWAFVAPATDDDGYFAAQARNAALSGEVGNYYQFFDQSFVPFTWPYQALSWWQQAAGLAPVVQRVPALVLGLLTWLVLRCFAASVLGAVPGRVARIGAHATLAAAFLAWWLPYDMGVRPEPAVAFCAAGAMLAVLVAAHRRRLAVAWLALVLAGAGFTAHTTGVVVLAVLLAGLPLLVPLLRVPGARAATALRVLAVGSGAMVAPLLGFADGALRDFLRGQALFLSVLDQEGWTDEFQRYGFLLAQVPMGSYARRAAVLACLVALGWFAVLAVAARLRGVALPAPLWLAGVTTALAFPALALTPSKWTHHFGALAGFGSAFLALMLVQAVPLTRRVLRGAPVTLGVLGAAAGSAVVAIALAWHGPNSWPYAWLEGVRTPGEPPAVRSVGLDGPATWALALLVVALALVLATRATGARLAVLRAVPVVVVASLVATTGYLVGTFADAAARGTPPGAIWTDPTGAGCGAAGAVRVLDPATARPLPAVGPPGPLGGFAVGGYYPANRPQAPGAVRGSFVSRNDASPDLTTGTTSTGWYALPAAGSVAVTAAGTLGGANALTAVYGRRAGSSVVPVGRQPLTDAARAPSWRTLVLAPPAGADVVRLDAVDATVDRNGWLAFTAPVAATPVLLADHLPDDAPVALGWQLAFGYPCQRQPGIVNGIVEPPAYAVLRGGTALAGLDDIAWRPGRGGAFGHVVRSRSVLQLATVGPVDPQVQVYRLGTPLAHAAYTVTTDRRTVAGADTSVAAAGPG